MQASEAYISYLKGAEQFSPRPYLDPPGNTRGQYSTAYGHLIRPNEKYLMTKVFTEPEAEALLRSDVKEKEADTNRALTRPVSQGQFDALLDVAFNAGPGNMQPIARLWNTTGSVADTAAKIKTTAITVKISAGQHKVLPVLISRRQHAAAWFAGDLSPVLSKAIDKAQNYYLLPIACCIGVLFIIKLIRS